MMSSKHPHHPIESTKSSFVRSFVVMFFVRRTERVFVAVVLSFVSTTTTLFFRSANGFALDVGFNKTECVFKVR